MRPSSSRRFCRYKATCWHDYGRGSGCECSSRRLLSRPVRDGPSATKSRPPCFGICRSVCLRPSVLSRVPACPPPPCPSLSRGSIGVRLYLAQIRPCAAGGERERKTETETEREREKPPVRQCREGRGSAVGSRWCRRERTRPGRRPPSRGSLSLLRASASPADRTPPSLSSASAFSESPAHLPPPSLARSPAHPSPRSPHAAHEVRVGPGGRARSRPPV